MKRKYSASLLLICAAIVAGISVTNISAQGYGDRNRAGSGGSYDISIKVLLPDGQPAVGAKITLSSSEYMGPNSGVADSEGLYTFSGVNGGNFNFTARLEGLPAETESLTIDRNSSASQIYNVVIYFRNPGQKKGDFYSANPMFKDVTKEALDRFKKGAEKVLKNDFKGALTFFDEAIAIYPQFAAAYYEKGAAHLKLTEYDKALGAFVKAIEIKPDYIQAKYSVGFTQFSMKNYDVATAVFADVIQQKKDMPQAMMYLGISLFYLNRIDQAEYALQKTITMKGGENLSLAHRYLGGIYVQKKKNAEAISELEKYLQLVPKAPDAEKLKQTISDLKKQG